MKRRNFIGLAKPLLGLASLPALGGCVSGIDRGRGGGAQVDGVVWQLDFASVRPRGAWHRLGARQLLVQWSVVDGIDFLGTGKTEPAPGLPDWRRIATEPWAQKIILGMAGRYDLAIARMQVDELAAMSLQITRRKLPFDVAGWYFPVEVDISWAESPSIRRALDMLPRPLWISVYDNNHVGGAALANWLAGWLPSDMGVFFQDGVGLHMRDQHVARAYADQLVSRLGANRVCLIAEAFRPKPGGGFRAAVASELKPQLAAYGGHVVFLFDGPHYVSDDLIDAMVTGPS